MPRNTVRLMSLLLGGLAIAACAPQAPPAPESGASGQGAPSRPARTLVMIAGGEAPTFAAKPLEAGSSGSRGMGAVLILNATLDFVDERGTPFAYLAEALPRPHTDSWRVFPDGRMETTYRLRPNLSWHDGTPLSAEDFVFAWKVYATPALGVSASMPIGPMAEVVAPDSQTVVIRWRQLYPDAALLKDGFQALPRHILERPFQQLEPEAFVNHPFWTDEYVGLGPYRLERREPGVSFEAQAFDGYVFGKPRIERVRVVYMSDTNAVLATMLAGEAHYVVESLIWFEEGAVLQREWVARGAGSVQWAAASPRNTQIQLRPELANPRELLDVRVRRALAQAIDRPGGFEAVTGSHGLIVHGFTHPFTDYYPLVEPALVKYAYDPRRAQQLLEEVGLVRGADGFYGGAEPFRLQVWCIASATNERENAIFVESLRRAGIDASSHVYPVVQLRDNQTRSRLPGLFTGAGRGGEASLAEYTIAAIPRPENRWQGNNRGGWVNAEYDRIWQVFTTTLDRSQRVEQVAQMERIISEELPTIVHYYTPRVIALVAGLHGPVIRQTPEAGTGVGLIHRWEWRS